MNRKDDAGSGSAVVDRLLGECAAAGSEGVLDIRVGPFWTVVRSSRGTGMASTMARAHGRGTAPPIDEAGRLLEQSLERLTSRLGSNSLPEAALGLAAVNSIVGRPEGHYEDRNARDLLLEAGRGRTVAMIGRFPFTEQLRSVARELWVFERGSGRRPDDLGSEHVPEVLPHADVVAISATTIINHTVDGILACVDPGALTLMLGPSTPMAPVLFELGVDVLAGSIIEDPEAVLKAVGQGAVTGQITGVRRVMLTRTETEFENKGNHRGTENSEGHREETL